MGILNKLIKYLIIGGLAALLLGAFILWSVYLYLNEELPDYQHLKNYDPPLVTRLYAEDGQLLEEYAQEHRAFVPVEYIPQQLIQAFLSAEDKNFYSHKGIDYLGIMRASLRNLRYFGQKKRPMGASSITQQVAKNFLLSGEVSIKRKLKEAILARKLENTFSKKKILELYLNEIYLGAGAYGIAAAALHYFNKSLQKLSLSEMAYLAGLPKAPNSYNLHRAPEKAKIRRDWVLKRMLTNGFTEQKAYDIAKSSPLIAQRHKQKKVFQAGYFSEYVRQNLVKKYGEEALYKGGLVVKTTLNPQYHAWADQALREGLVAYDRRHGYRGAYGSIPLEKEGEIVWQKNLKAFKTPAALGSYKLAVVLHMAPKKTVIGLRDGTRGIIPLKLMVWARKQYKSSKGQPTVGKSPKDPKEVFKIGQVIAVESTKKVDEYKLAQIPSVEGAIVVMDPHTGRILALSGGYSFSRSKYNRAIQANRQTGSAFKTFVFLAGLEEGYNPTTRILDKPIEIDLGPNLGTWAPNNMSMKFYGPVTLRLALEKSYNVSTVQLAKKIGLEKIVEMVKNFGVDTILEPQWSMVLGANETSLLKMVTGFSQIANGGKKIEPIFIDRVQDRRGRTLQKNTLMECYGCMKENNFSFRLPILNDNREQLIDPRHAYQMTSILQGAMERGTGRNASVKPYALAGKTGSTNGFRDAWFLGYSPDLAVGVYVGFDSPKGLGNWETGARAAAPIFKNFMSKALKKSPPAPFRTPSGLVFKKVNAITGLLAKPGDPIRVEGLIPNEKGEVVFEEEPIGSDKSIDILEESFDKKEKEVDLAPKDLILKEKVASSKKEGTIIDPWIMR